jgi:lipopolysaccharide/colanic/teichoic acid biosynthesis glycosyltransferase
MARIAGIPRFEPLATETLGPLRSLARIRFQLLGGLALAVFLPALFKGAFELRPSPGSLQNSMLATMVAVCVGLYVLRKMLPFPGVRATAFVLPTFTAVYALVATGFLLLRIDYSRFQLLASFLLAVPWFMFVSIVERRYRRPRLALVPGGDSRAVCALQQADWCALDQPNALPAGVSGVVADLRADLDPDWEKLLAVSALRGIPVYHSKHVVESLTGRVEIEHLSENSLGSLLPSSVYLRLKHFVDTLGVFVALPFAIPICFVAAFLIKLEDGGPVLFTQARMGHRGNVFTIFKFRTMCCDAPQGSAFTAGNDPRVTQIGRFLRRYRIDELPQIWNILKGEMSWIGPRPESLPLSETYELAIPFYSYRHIVRPGITGWAQVQQGWAAEVKEVTGKLHYDFFYIKHFSPWLDLLIAARTIRTVLTGFGAR